MTAVRGPMEFEKKLDDFELREEVIERFDIYDVVELLDLKTEDLVDTFDLLGYEAYRRQLIQAIEDR